MEFSKRALRCLIPLFASLMAAGHANSETVAWWRFEQQFSNESGAVELDIAAGPDVTFSESVPGSVVAAGSVMLPNKASYGNGSKSDSRVENAAAIDEAVSKGSFTIEAFIKIEALDQGDGFETAFCRIVGTAINEADGGWALVIHQDKLRFHAFNAKNGEIVTLTSQADLARNIWHHVALVGMRDGEFLDLQIYINGEAQTETAQIEGLEGNAIMPLKSPCIIGGYNPFLGLIDELRISNKALSASEFLTAKQ